MIIQVDGAGCVNKGAQLMLTAVMQEIKQKFPDAYLIVNSNKAGESFIKQYYGNKYIIKRKESFYQLVSKLHLVKLSGFVSRRISRFFTTKHAIKGVDFVINVGGFQFGDQWNHTNTNIADWRDYLSELHRYGTKIIFMPQAFGPFEKENSKKMLDVISKKADILIARDDVSYNYLMAENIDKRKVMLFPDFTALVAPQESTLSIQHKGKVCIIPNSKIIKQGIMSEDSYLTSIGEIINHIYENGREVLLLNHEGIGDYKLCNKAASIVKHPVTVITGLNAIETKGVIADSYLVISSRFHGVANSLSSSVPCLATSWSHKYQELLSEYGQDNCLIDLSDSKASLSKIDKMLMPDENNRIRTVLFEKNNEIKIKIGDMWKSIWTVLDLS